MPKRVQAAYRIKRLDQVSGKRADRAIGMTVPSKKGLQPYTRQNLNYDIRTGAITLEMVNKADGDEHQGTSSQEQRPIPTAEQEVEPPTIAEVKSVRRAQQQGMATAALPDIANDAILTVEIELEKADQQEATTRSTTAAAAVALLDPQVV
jgi:hypothetical protein